MVWHHKQILHQVQRLYHLYVTHIIAVLFDQPFNGLIKWLILVNLNSSFEENDDKIFPQIKVVYSMPFLSYKNTYKPVVKNI